MNIVRRLLPFAALALTLGIAAPSPAQNIMDEWASAQLPPPPQLQSVTVDPKTTALLMLDFLKPDCSPNPRCMGTLAPVAKLLAAARDKKMFVVYTKFPIPGPKEAETLPQVAPTGKEPVVISFLDKFYKTNLDKILKGKHIKTVIVVGSASNGAVLFTAYGAFERGYQVIVPVDGLSGKNPYVDQSVVNDFVTSPVMGGKITLTKTGMVTIK
jgi:nicotinamidase-related amidase